MSYHVSMDGKVRPCRSKGPCPFGTRFDNVGAAEDYSVILNEEVDIQRDAIDQDKSYSDEQAETRGEFVSKTVSRLLDEGRATKSLYYNRDLKEWNVSRAKAHSKILDRLHSKYDSVPTDGKVVFSAGLPGAGKTTVLEMLPGINIDDYAIVSSDDFKEELAKDGLIPKINGLDDMEASTLVHEESSYLADKFLEELSAKNKNIIYDFTCKNSKSTQKRMGILTDENYKEKDMQFVFVDIPLETASERALGRYKEGLNNSVEYQNNKRNGIPIKDKDKDDYIGGRYLPPKILEMSKSKTGRYSSINAEALLEVYKGNKDNGLPKPIVYDNSGNKFVNPEYKPERQDFDKFASR